MFALMSLVTFGQATTRTVTGTLRKPDTTAWAGAKIICALSKGSFTATTQFPATSVTITTDADGNFSTPLWTTSEALKYTRYECTMPDGEIVKFSLSPGAPIGLSQIRENTALPTTSTPSVQSLIDAYAASLQPTLDAKLTQTTADTRYSPLEHRHDVDSIDGLGSVAELSAPSMGNAASNQVVLGNDSRLTDSRTPLAHTHTSIANGTGSVTTNSNGSVEINAPNGEVAIGDVSDDGIGTTIRLNDLEGTISFNGQFLFNSTSAGNLLTRNAPATGDATNTQVVLGSDTRLIDPRAPLMPYAAKTTAYTVALADGIIGANATSGAFSVTLSTAIGKAGRSYTVKKIDASANAVTVTTTSSQTIDGATSYSLAVRWKYLTVTSDGANWLITANN